MAKKNVKHKSKRIPLPGDVPEKARIDAMIRVNHAGEYGAKRIYQGQLAVLRGKASAPVIQHMAEQEEKHLRYFNDAIVTRGVRPTVLSPVWHVLGFALGAGTAMLGEKAAMACTVAVEEVIDEHYRKQVDTLGEEEKELKATIEQFRKEELEHRDTGLSHHAEEAPAYFALTQAVKATSRLAIWLSTRF
ncbi:MAG: demethoxyubiquinone hydroxylase family protein [Proteobacteria bacterium]|nr:demethoxyubiquinone hydroxylase family protein [Pseudomonadota bacterium]